MQRICVEMEELVGRVRELGREIAALVRGQVKHWPCFVSNYSCN